MMIRFLRLAVFVIGIHGLLCVAQEFPADNAPDRLTIATWNVEWFFDDQLGDNQSKIAKEEAAPNSAYWKWKCSAVADSIAKMHPTVMALQEIEGKSVLHELVGILKNQHQLSYRIAFVEGFDGSTEQDVGVLFQSGCVAYGRREQNNKMFTSQNFYNLSKHLFVDFEWESQGHLEPLTLLNVHLRAREEAASERRKQSKLAHYMLRDRILAKENVVLLGDMNLESFEGQASTNDDGIEALTGRATLSTDDDLIDLHSKLPSNQRRTHLVLDKQFDRILVSRPMMEDTPNVPDWVFERIEILSDLVIRGSDPIEDHWEKRFTKPVELREPSDHFPVMATFELK